jgi:phosphoglycolate phosphatase-like HAD superfamily hydrolase
MSTPADPQAELRAFKKTKSFFVGIDSDGCAFDSMEVKHKECFIPNIIKTFELAAISKYAREVAEFINLYSQWRGLNRFPGLTLTFDLLANRPEVQRRGFRLPPVPGLRAWLATNPKLSNAALKEEIERTDDPDLVATMQWSDAVNKSVSEIVHDLPPFPYVRESLNALDDRADVIVCSATPGEALKREWKEHGLSRHVALIAGQELGSKTEQLKLAAAHQYDRDKILMVGDALGDLKAAESVGALFYPIDPGYEDESWARFHDDVLPRFFDGKYNGAFMDEQILRFKKLLPTNVPWPTIKG